MEQYPSDLTISEKLYEYLRTMYHTLAIFWHTSVWLGTQQAEAPTGFDRHACQPAISPMLRGSASR